MRFTLTFFLFFIFGSPAFSSSETFLEETPVTGANIYFWEADDNGWSFSSLPESYEEFLGLSLSCYIEDDTYKRFFFENPTYIGKALSPYIYLYSCRDYFPYSAEFRHVDDREKKKLKTASWQMTTLVTTRNYKTISSMKNYEIDSVTENKKTIVTKSECPQEYYFCSATGTKTRHGSVVQLFLEAIDDQPRCILNFNRKETTLNWLPKTFEDFCECVKKKYDFEFDVFWQGKHLTSENYPYFYVQASLTEAKICANQLNRDEVLEIRPVHRMEIEEKSIEELFRELEEIERTNRGGEEVLPSNQEPSMINDKK